KSSDVPQLRFCRVSLTPCQASARLERLQQSIRPRRLSRGWTGAAIVAAAAAVVVVAIPRRAAVVQEAVAAHACSLQVDHAFDVKATDEHVVKPWLEGKVGFTVPARDYASEGYALAGGRLDYLDGRPAAALVYRHGKHLLNLFVVDAEGDRDAPPKRDTLRGFGCWRWTSAGLRYLLVGDVEEAQMGALARRMAGI